MEILKFWKPCLSKILISIVLIQISGCGVNLNPVLKSPIRSLTDLKTSVNISVPEINGGVISLDGRLNKPTLIIFAQDTCDVCGQETEMILSHLNNVQELKINIITILIGTILDDALWWVDLFEVPWQVGLDFQGKFFKQYCSQNTVPCMLIYDPNNGLVLRHHGEISFEQIQYYTGPWY